MIMILNFIISSSLLYYIDILYVSVLGVKEYCFVLRPRGQIASGTWKYEPSFNYEIYNSIFYALL